MKMTRKVIADKLPGFAELTKGRDFISTEEFAKSLGLKSQTIRKKLCVDGTAYGITPVKFGRGLLWPVDKVAAILVELLGAE